MHLGSPLLRPETTQADHGSREGEAAAANDDAVTFGGICYVYVHIRASDHLPFYVGKGTGKRAWSSASRTRWWNSIRAKHGWIVEIVGRDLSEKEAHALEVRMIAQFRREGFPLCNMTDGGEGRAGHVSGRRKTVYCSNGMKFPSSMAAAEWLRLQGHKRASSKNISAACNGRKLVVYGHCWSNKERPASIDLKGRPARARNAGREKAIPVYRSDGIRFESASDAGRACGGTYGVILRACRGDVLTAHGYTWSFEPGGCPKYESPMDRSNRAKLKPIRCSNGMTFPSHDAAVAWGRAQGLRLSHPMLHRCIRNPHLKSGGLYWSEEI